MPITFYDRTGKAVAYAEDDVHVYLYSGRPVAHVIEGSVYAYSGRHLGTLRAGMLRDHEGRCVFFTDDAAEDGSTLPEKRLKPPKLLKKPKPPKERREAAPTRPADAEGWSELSPETFFTS